jgi:hypothetical protein
METIALQFNDCINEKNIERLGYLMSEDHLFVDSLNNTINGKLNNIENWNLFFDLFPDYRNVLETVCVNNSTVVMYGHSVCSDNRLNHVQAIWVAQIANDKVKEWRIYPDTEENRRRFGFINK